MNIFFGLRYELVDYGNGGRIVFNAQFDRVSWEEASSRDRDLVLIVQTGWVV